MYFKWPKVHFQDQRNKIGWVLSIEAALACNEHTCKRTKVPARDINSSSLNFLESILTLGRSNDSSFLHSSEFILAERVLLECLDNFWIVLKKTLHFSKST
jgi:hypothetical protein